MAGDPSLHGAHEGDPSIDGLPVISKGVYCRPIRDIPAAGRTGCRPPEETHGEPPGHTLERAARDLAPGVAWSCRRRRPRRRGAVHTQRGERACAPPLGCHCVHGRLQLPAHRPPGVRRRADEERRHARGGRDQRSRRRRRQEDQPLDPRHRRHRSRQDQDEPAEARQRQGRRALRGLPDPVAGLDGHQGQLRRTVAQRLDVDRPGAPDQPAAGQVREHLPDRPARVVLRPRLPGLPEQRQGRRQVEARRTTRSSSSRAIRSTRRRSRSSRSSRRPSRAGRSRASRRSPAAPPTGRPRPRRPRTPRPPS